MVSLHSTRCPTARSDPSVLPDALAGGDPQPFEDLTTREISLVSWLHRTETLLQICRTHIGALRRAALREEALSLTRESKVLFTAPSEDRSMRHEITRRITSAISRLPQNDRDVIVLKHFEELSFAEAAVVLNVSTAAIYSRYYRAVQRLHRLISEDCS